MLSFDRQYMLEVSRWTLSPGLAIFLPAFALHLVGNGPRDALDPRLSFSTRGRPEDERQRFGTRVYRIIPPLAGSCVRMIHQCE